MIMSTHLQTAVDLEMAHRLYDVDTYSEECRENLHGHTFQVSFQVGRYQLNDAGMVMDFKLLKKIIKETIEDPFDHSSILRSTDPIVPVIKENCNKVHVVDDNPTAEWLAHKFFDLLEAALEATDPKMFVKSVSVRETANNIATYTRD